MIIIIIPKISLLRNNEHLSQKYPNPHDMLAFWNVSEDIYKLGQKGR